MADFASGVAQNSSWELEGRCAINAMTAEVLLPLWCFLFLKFDIASKDISGDDEHVLILFGVAASEASLGPAHPVLDRVGVPDQHQFFGLRHLHLDLVVTE